MNQAAQSQPQDARAGWPAMSIAQANALLTAPGAMFEMETLQQDDRTVRAWKNGPKSLAELFEMAKAFADREFMVHDSERVTYEAFARAATTFARALIARGVRKGDRVAIAMRNLPEWPVAFYGTALAGAVATPLNAWWSGAELVYGLNDCGAVAAVFDRQRFERVSA